MMLPKASWRWLLLVGSAILILGAGVISVNYLRLRESVSESMELSEGYPGWAFNYYNQWVGGDFFCVIHPSTVIVQWRPERILIAGHSQFEQPRDANCLLVSTTNQCTFVRLPDKCFVFSQYPMAGDTSAPFWFLKPRGGYRVSLKWDVAKKYLEDEKGFVIEKLKEYDTPQSLDQVSSGDTHNRACQGSPANSSLNNTPLCFFFEMRALQTPIRTDTTVQDKLRGGPAQSL